MPMSLNVSANKLQELKNSFSSLFDKYDKWTETKSGLKGLKWGNTYQNLVLFKLMIVK